MKTYRVLSWSFLILALIVLGSGFYIFYNTQLVCVPSCPLCDDCGGPRDYSSVISFGIADIILWGLWIWSIFWIKKKNRI